MEKRNVFIFFILVVVFSSCVSPMTLSPASIDLNFVPNYKETFTFNVKTDDSSQRIGIYSEGDLKEYISFNKDEIVGSGSFEATLDLPSDIEKPGNHKITIGAKEELPEEDEEVKGMLGARVKLQASINVFVPYPGKYLEIDLKSENANAGDPVEFLIDVINRGKEDVSMKPKIDIFSEGEKKETLEFYERELDSKKEITLQKELNTSDYPQGDYKAAANIEYGGEEPAEDVENFSLGHLFVNLLNYSKRVRIRDTENFNVLAESRWNNKIEDVHAEVSFLNDNKEIYNLKTPSESLEPWEEKNLSGFVETNKFNESSYKTNISLHYDGESSSEIVEVEFFKEKDNKMIYIIVVSALVLAAVLVIVWFKFIRKKQRK